MKWKFAALFLATVALSAFGGKKSELADPVKLEANGKAIDVDVGHAAPFVADLDGDGKLDLLVGQFGEGKLRVYRNTGTNAKRVFAAHTWFKAGGVDGTVPSG